MKRESVFLLVLLWFAILTLWVDGRWAWGLFQVGIFCLAASRFVFRNHFPRSVALIPLAFVAVWAWLQLALRTAVSPAETTSAAWNWLTFFLVCALTFDAGLDWSDARLMLKVLAISGMLIAVVSAIQMVSSPGRIFWFFPSGYTDGVLGPFVNRNQYAAWVELLLPIALYSAGSRDRYRSLYLFAAAVLYGSVVAGASRAGFILTTAEAVTTLVLLAVRRRLPRKTLWQFAALAAAAVVAVGWQGLQARFQDPASEALRLDALRASIRMVHDRPFTGTGLGSWPQVYPRYASFDAGVFLNQAHNDWAQWAAEGGLPFFLLLLLFAALCWKPAFRSIYGVGVVAFLLHAVVDYPMQQRPGLAAWFFAVAGLVLARGNAIVRDH